MGFCLCLIFGHRKACLKDTNSFTIVLLLFAKTPF